MILIWNLKGCLDFQFPSSITQNWWVPQLSSVFGCILVFISITQFFDFWVMSYRNWKHILSVFRLSKLSFHGILVIKHTYMGPTVRVTSHQCTFDTTCNGSLHQWEPNHSSIFIPPFFFRVNYTTIFILPPIGA